MRCSRKHENRKSGMRMSVSKKKNGKKKQSTKQKKMINSRKEIVQEGGMGGYTQFWNQHPHFETVNRDNNNFMLLNPIKSTNQFDKYNTLMDNMFVLRNGIIDLDFISNFFRNIYYDTNNQYSIKTITKAEYDRLSEGEKDRYCLNSEGRSIRKAYGFVNPDRIAYRITRVIEQPHGNTVILFLRKRIDNPNLPEELTLKIFLNSSSFQVV